MAEFTIPFLSLTGLMALALTTMPLSASADTSDYESWVEETAISQANSSMKDTQLCLEGVETERFDPASGDCGEGWPFDMRVAFYRKLILEMPPPIDQ